MIQNKILYSLCWEDPELISKSLDISPIDSVLSIASGGENVFAILLMNPGRLVAIDVNPCQIYLLELKMAAVKSLSFDEFTGFLGFARSISRIKYFKRCKAHLSENALKFWEGNLGAIRKGIVHCGKFESYLHKFRKYILSIVLSKRQIKKYLSLGSTREQALFFEREWNNWRWKLLFRIFFSKTVMQLFGRKRDYFKYINNRDIAKHYFERSRNGFTKMPVKKNYFVNYILTGKIPIPFKDHPYLDKANFYKLKGMVGRIELVNSDIYHYLKGLEEGSFSKYNLSDVFELASQEEYEDMLNEISRASRRNSLICYWNNLVFRASHPNVKSVISDEKLSGKLFKGDRVPFYSRFIVESIHQ
ncbi:MAG: BtaA family protein [Nanoarchaeota archaeon]|nr:BtaA family protein [Nanoarchaeota archaeon]MBU1005406.1 BtaA family protein [Nanoarchaeota archaeon]